MVCAQEALEPGLDARGAAAAQRPSRGLVALALALLLALQPVTTDLYLPALPLLTRELNGSLASAQATMAMALLSFGFGQLFFGPLGDRLGRRPVLLWGLGLNALASFAGAMADSMGWLIAVRALQGLGLAAVVVCARALVRDLYEPSEGARIMATALGGLGVIALLCPLTGGLLTTAGGWRAPLVAVGLFGSALAVFIAWRWPETIARRNPAALQLAPLARTWRSIAAHPRFRAWAALVACSYGALFTVLAGSSFVFMGQLGMPPWLYGLALASCSAGYIAGTFICRRWLGRVGLAHTVRRGALFTAASVIGLAPVLWLREPAWWQLMAPIWLFALGHGCHQPCGQTGAVGPFPQAAGAASALAGFLLAGTAFGIGLWLGHALRGGAAAFAGTIMVFGALTVLVACTLVQSAEGGAAGALSPSP